MNKDIYTNEVIKGRTKKDRDLMLFQNRQNMLSYVKEHPDKAKAVFYALLKNRKLQKDLIYAPSTVELRSSILPTVTLMKKHGVNYKELYESLGYIGRFDYESQFEFNSNTIEFWQDTREQKPLNIPNCRTVTLSFGDYASPSNPNIVIERKSINDLVSTISQGYDRLQEEIKRAAENDVYVILLVETLLGKSLSFNYLPQMKWAKATPDFIFSRIRDLIQNYSNFQIGFCDGRIDMTVLMNRIYNFKGDIKKVDIQWGIDEKLL